MGASESLRKAVGYFGGGSRDEDEGYESHGEYDERADERDDAHTLVLLQPSRPGFFLAAPYVFDDVQEIGSRLKADTPVIVDLHGCGRGLSERIVDFCSGLVCALNGNVYSIGAEILLLTPRCVDLSSDSGADAFRQGLYSQG